MPDDFHPECQRSVHPSNEELLQAADADVSGSRGEQIRAHLGVCGNCRARVARMETLLGEVTGAYRENLDSHVPPIDGSRELLRGRLAEAALKGERGGWWFFEGTSFKWVAAYVCLVLLGAAVVGEISQRYMRVRTANLSASSLEGGVVPDRRLTPGMTRRVSLADVCSMAHEDVVRAVPTKLSEEVFQEYGIANPGPAEFEIDYLIAPGLGGAEDINNLWPEPYKAEKWNARDKDALEERLHEMVCAGKLDLSTAQSDIAKNWVAAYKKYFHTDNPIAPRSGVDDLPDERHEESGLLRFQSPVTLPTSLSLLNAAAWRDCGLQAGS